MKDLTTLAIAASLIMLAGCGGSDAEPTAAIEEPTSPQSAAWILTSIPEGAVSVTEAKASATEGDEVVVRGRIGGRLEPMSADSPVFTIVDLELPYCGELHEDGCRTPWDYCCETPDTIASNTATVQVVSDGEIDLTAGLEPLDEVILRGIVGPRPDERVLTIRATGVYPVGG